MSTMKMGSDYDQNEEGPPGTDDVKPYTREELGLFPDGPALNVEGMVGLSVEKYNRLLNTARAGPEDQDVEPTNETLDDIMSEPEVFRAWSHYDNVPIPERGDARMLVAAILRADRRRTRSGRASPTEGG